MYHGALKRSGLKIEFSHDGIVLFYILLFSHDGIIRSCITTHTYMQVSPAVPDPMDPALLPGSQSSALCPSTLSAMSRTEKNSGTLESHHNTLILWSWEQVHSVHVSVCAHRKAVLTAVPKGYIRSPEGNSALWYMPSENTGTWIFLGRIAKHSDHWWNS